MFTPFLYASIATILLVIVLSILNVRRVLANSLYEGVLMFSGVIWLAAGMLYPTVTAGIATIHVGWMGGLLVLYAVAHWFYVRFGMQKPSV